jgi:hypothetical protein
MSPLAKEAVMGRRAVARRLSSPRFAAPALADRPAAIARVEEQFDGR